jgi:hypothetical protein
MLFYDDGDLWRAQVFVAKLLFQIAREFMGRFSGSRNLADQRLGDVAVCFDLYGLAKVGHLNHCYVEHVEWGDFVGFIPGRRYGCRLLCSRRRERPGRSRSTDSGNEISPYCVDCHLPHLIRFLLCRSASDHHPAPASY